MIVYFLGQNFEPDLLFAPARVLRSLAGQLLDNLRRRESRRSISTTKDEMGIPLPPRRNPLMRPSRCWTPL